MLKQRMIAALVLIPLVIAALFMLPLKIFAYIVIAICVLAAWEWGQFAGLKSINQRVILAIVAGIGLVFMFLPFSSNEVLSSPFLLSSTVIRGSLWIALAWWTIAIGLVLFYPSSAFFWRNSRLLRLFFGAVTIVPFFWGMIALRQHSYLQDSYVGAWWLLYVMVLVWGADSGAYAFGHLLGKHKLAPKVSPGKTIEGLCGGLLTAGFIAWLFALYAPLAISFCSLLICSIIAVFASVLGDLTESMFKREAGVKDSGHLIPGHGGILDRIDSLTSAIPVFACLILLVFNG